MSVNTGIRIKYSESVYCSTSRGRGGHCYAYIITQACRLPATSYSHGSSFIDIRIAQ